jgi:Zn finger protein HypA/HybF involved in hydrogenase expression
MHFTVGFPTDDGFLGRECNAAGCRKYFKVQVSSIREQMHCPYCGEMFRNNELWTTDQLDYAREKVAREVMPLVEKEVRDIFRNAFQGKPGWTFRSGDPSPPRPEPALPEQKSVDSELTCPGCATRFQVDGIFGYCPGCRSENLRLYDANLAIIKAEILTSPNPTRALRHAYNDLVSTFEVFARKEAERHGLEAGRFQNLAHTRRFFRQALGTDCFHDLTTDEIRLLKRVFEKRHVHEHNEGIVSARYVREIPEDHHLLGKLAPLSVQELEAASLTLRRVLAALVMLR